MAFVSETHLLHKAVALGLAPKTNGSHEAVVLGLVPKTNGLYRAAAFGHVPKTNNLFGPSLLALCQRQIICLGRHPWYCAKD